jgi:hypothetical protein
MGSLMSTGLEQLNAGSGYKFSATKINELGAAEYTLATIVCDASGSVADYAAELEKSLKTVYRACDKSPRRDNLMLRCTQFTDTLCELHGFKLLGAIQEDDYTGILNLGGMTALFDAVDEALVATATYGKQLTAQDFLCNGIVVVITDGQNNRGSIMDAPHIKKTLEAVRRSENLESLLLILVGVTRDDTSLDYYLRDVKDGGGFDQYVSIGAATPGKIAKLAEFISQSISSTSTSLGTGQASTLLDPKSFTF